DFHVTGVQTCALPIYDEAVARREPRVDVGGGLGGPRPRPRPGVLEDVVAEASAVRDRSVEEPVRGRGPHLRERLAHAVERRRGLADPTPAPVETRPGPEALVAAAEHRSPRQRG